MSTNGQTPLTVLALMRLGIPHDEAAELREAARTAWAKAKTQPLRVTAAGFVRGLLEPVEEKPRAE